MAIKKGSAFQLSPFVVYWWSQAGSLLCAAFIGGGGVDGFAAGTHRDEGWNTKVNINVGYYF